MLVDREEKTVTKSMFNGHEHFIIKEYDLSSNETGYKQHISGHQTTHPYMILLKTPMLKKSWKHIIVSDFPVNLGWDAQIAHISVMFRCPQIFGYTVYFSGPTRIKIERSKEVSVAKCYLPVHNVLVTDNWILLFLKIKNIYTS